MAQEDSWQSFVSEATVRLEGPHKLRMKRLRQEGNPGPCSLCLKKRIAEETPGLRLLGRWDFVGHDCTPKKKGPTPVATAGQRGPVPDTHSCTKAYGDMGTWGLDTSDFWDAPQCSPFTVNWRPAGASFFSALLVLPP
jgi:hypothetical protein